MSEVDRIFPWKVRKTRVDGVNQGYWVGKKTKLDPLSKVHELHNELHKAGGKIKIYPFKESEKFKVARRMEKLGLVTLTSGLFSTHYTVELKERGD